MFTKINESELATSEQKHVNDLLQEIGQWLIDEMGVEPFIHLFVDGDISLTWRHHGLDISLIGWSDEDHGDLVVIEGGEIIHFVEYEGMGDFSVDNFLRSYKPKKWKNADAGTKKEGARLAGREGHSLSADLGDLDDLGRAKRIRNWLIDDKPMSNYRRGMLVGVLGLLGTMAIVASFFLVALLTISLSHIGDDPAMDMIERTQAEDSDLLLIQSGEHEITRTNVGDYLDQCGVSHNCLRDYSNAEVCVVGQSDSMMVRNSDGTIRGIERTGDKQCASYTRHANREGGIRDFGIDDTDNDRLSGTVAESDEWITPDMPEYWK